MSTRRRRARLLIAALVILPLIALGAYGLGYRLDLQTAQVAEPPASATPEQVSLAYLDAFNHRDRATMKELFPTRGRVSGVRALGHYSKISIQSGHPMSDAERAGGAGERHRDAYLVAVRLDYTGFDDTEMSYTPGPNGWSYYLVRDDPNERRTIAHQGVL